MIRRNGKLRSCEPCRKSKIRCDHKLPICQNCESRKIVDRCFYHPAPLTRGIGVAQRRSIEPVSSSDSSLRSSRPGNRACRAVQTSGEQSFNQGTTSLGNSASQQPLYLGATTYGAVFSEAQKNRPAVEYSIPPSHTEAGVKILASLRPFSLYEALVERYFQLSQVTPIAAGLVLSAVPYLKADLETGGTPNTDEENRALSARITENTSRPLRIPASIGASDFYSLLTGPNLRWEFIGFFMTVAGLCAQSVSDTDYESLGTETTVQPIQLDDIAEASSACLQLCQSLGTVNDVLIWLIYYNGILLSFRYGESSHLVWRSLGDLSTEMMAMGLHKDPGDSTEAPLFILETRRKIYAGAYTIDKSLSTFLGRPPKIPEKYSNNRLPLDLNDEDLLAEGPALDDAISSLDENGWNRTPNFRPAAWIRLRYTMSVFREEILELSLGADSVGILEKLDGILERSQLAWDAMPAYLQYDSSWWDQEIPRSACLISMVAYQSYLVTRLETQKMLSRHSQGNNDEVLNTSMQLLITITSFVKQRIHTPALQRDFGWIVLTLGLPGAVELATELRRCAEVGDQLPSSIPRPLLIRNLSVFISSLECVRHPGEGNYELCKAASQMLARFVDESLDPSLISRDVQAADPPPDPTGHDFLPADSDEFMQWLDSFDWNSTSNQWAI